MARKTVAERKIAKLPAEPQRSGRGSRQWSEEDREKAANRNRLMNALLHDFSQVQRTDTGLTLETLLKCVEESGAGGDTLIYLERHPEPVQSEIEIQKIFGSNPRSVLVLKYHTPKPAIDG